MIEGLLFIILNHKIQFMNTSYICARFRWQYILQRISPFLGCDGGQDPLHLWPAWSQHHWGDGMIVVSISVNQFDKHHDQVRGEIVSQS